MFGVIILCIIFGTIMYLIESNQSGFTSIPRSIYWCVVTLTTVGVAAGTVLPYTISGVSSSDIGGVSLTGGSFTVGADGTAQVTFNVTEDFTVETAETFTLSLNLP